jgi:hypothetical protein
MAQHHPLFLQWMNAKGCGAGLFDLHRVFGNLLRNGNSEDGAGRHSGMMNLARSLGVGRANRFNDGNIAARHPGRVAR